ncbi:MAG: hypothetical protein HDS32_01365 [Bacteroides sp.]|nr:hypothetical protein [Bacteroides sp.]
MNTNENLTDDINVVSEEETPKQTPKKVSPLILLGEIMVTGTAGWKQLRRSRLTPEQTAAGCFYPIIALASVCKFADWIYLPEFNLSDTLIKAASVFASFFFSYFAIQVVCRWFFPTETKSKTELNYFKHIVQYALSSLAIFWIPAEVLPILEPLVVFLPIWTAFIITKSIRFLRLPQAYHNRCMVTMILSIIIMPYLFMWICGLIF